MANLSLAIFTPEKFQEVTVMGFGLIIRRRSHLPPGGVEGVKGVKGVGMVAVVRKEQYLWLGILIPSLSWRAIRFITETQKDKVTMSTYLSCLL